MYILIYIYILICDYVCMLPRRELATVSEEKQSSYYLWYVCFIYIYVARFAGQVEDCQRQFSCFKPSPHVRWRQPREPVTRTTEDSSGRRKTDEEAVGGSG